MKQHEPKIWRGVLLSVVVGASWPWAGTSRAQEQEVSAAGKNVFAQHCVVCHGRDAKGDGVAASLLTVKPADLTQIAKRAGGEFPFWKVYGIIDGREDVK